jgi:hypothetical protein
MTQMSIQLQRNNQLVLRLHQRFSRGFRAVPYDFQTVAEESRLAADQEDPNADTSAFPNLESLIQEEIPLPRIQNTSQQQQSIRTVTMDESIKTVEELWEEWSVGQNGSRPIKEVEAEGSGWRNHSPSLNKYFQRRKRIIDLVTRKMQSGLDEAASVQLVENLRGTSSLHSFSEKILKEKRNGNSDYL